MQTRAGRDTEKLDSGACAPTHESLGEMNLFGCAGAPRGMCLDVGGRVVPELQEIIQEEL